MRAEMYMLLTSVLSTMSGALGLVHACKESELPSCVRSLSLGDKGAGSGLRQTSGAST